MDITKLTKKTGVLLAFCGVVFVLSSDALADCECLPNAFITIEVSDCVCLGDAPTIITDHFCGYEERYPGRTGGPDTPCNPCVECEGCELDVDIPEITEPGIYNISATLTSSCGTMTENKELKVIDCSWPDWSLGGSLEVPSGLFDGVNSILNPAGIEVTFVGELGVEYREKDCCNGEKEKEIKGFIKASMGGSKSWGPEYEVKAGSDVCSITFRAWAQVTVSVGTDFTGSGIRKIDCDDSIAYSGEISGNVGISADISTGFETCKTLCGVSYCSGAEITPVEISATAGFAVLYENGNVEFNASLGCIKLSANIEVGPFNYDWELPLAGDC